MENIYWIKIIPKNLKLKKRFEIHILHLSMIQPPDNQLRVHTNSYY